MSLNLKAKVPFGLIALCAFSVIGLKDTGVFISEHVQRTYSGNEVKFAIGEKVNIEKAEGNNYTVTKGKAKVTIPKDKIVVTEVEVPTYKVKKSAPIKKNGKILRSLFIGEYAVEVENKADVITIKCNDGTVGDVEKQALEKVASTRENVTEVKVSENAVAKAKESGEVMTVKAGDNVNVVNYKDGQFIIKNDEGKKFSISQDKLDINAGQKINDNILEKESDELKDFINNNRETKKVDSNVVKVNTSTGYDKILNTSFNSNASGVARKAIASAESKLGSTYVYGDTGKSGYDCSGLIYSIYKEELGISIPRSSMEQSNYGKQVSQSDLQEGDLVFFNTTGEGVSHVGLYIGNGKFIHASSGQGRVITSSLSESYYESRYVNATRII